MLAEPAQMERGLPNALALLAPRHTLALDPGRPRPGKRLHVGTQRRLRGPGWGPGRVMRPLLELTQAVPQSSPDF